MNADFFFFEFIFLATGFPPTFEFPFAKIKKNHICFEKGK